MTAQAFLGSFSGAVAEERKICSYKSFPKLVRSGSPGMTLKVRVPSSRLSARKNMVFSDFLVREARSEGIHMGHEEHFDSALQQSLNDLTPNLGTLSLVRGLERFVEQDDAVR